MDGASNDSGGCRQRQFPVFSPAIYFFRNTVDEPALLHSDTQSIVGFSLIHPKMRDLEWLFCLKLFSRTTTYDIVHPCASDVVRRRTQCERPLTHYRVGTLATLRFQMQVYIVRIFFRRTEKMDSVVKELRGNAP